jgi:phosphoribosylformylglycinamidine synthase
MAFAAHCGVSIDTDGLCYDPLMNDVDGNEKRPNLLGGRSFEMLMRALFNEELGAVVQIRRAERSQVMAVLRAAGLGACSQFIGAPNPWDQIRIIRNAKAVLTRSASICSAPGRRPVSACSTARQPGMRAAGIRPHPRCHRPGLSVTLSFDPADDVAAPFINTGARPRVAILREQGVNGHVEMAAAFDRAGFAAIDVHMSDILAGRVALADFKGAVACGGFSYGDVLGAGQGWAKTILFNERARETSRPSSPARTALPSASATAAR